MKDPKVSLKLGLTYIVWTIQRAEEEGIDLGKAGDQWKLDRAEFQLCLQSRKVFRSILMWHQISTGNPGEKNDSPKGGLVIIVPKGVFQLLDVLSVHKSITDRY